MVIFIKRFISYINNIIKNVAQAGLICGCGNTTCRFFHFFDKIKSVKKRQEKTFELNEVRSRASRPEMAWCLWSALGKYELLKNDKDLYVFLKVGAPKRHWQFRLRSWRSMRLSRMQTWRLPSRPCLSKRSWRCSSGSAWLLLRQISNEF